MRNLIVESVKDYIREPYAWPGGYPKALFMTDGECLCVKCAKDNFRLIVDSTKSNARDDGWCAMGVDINWEDENLYCANCNAHIESAYGED